MTANFTDYYAANTTHQIGTNYYNTVGDRLKVVGFGDPRQKDKEQGKVSKEKGNSYEEYYIVFILYQILEVLFEWISGSRWGITRYRW